MRAADEAASDSCAPTVAALSVLNPVTPFDLDQAQFQLAYGHLDLVPSSIGCAAVGADPPDHTMAESAPQQLLQSQERRRVKVYELRKSDWHDRGTGFCFAALVEVSCKTRSQHASSENACIIRDHAWR